MTQAELLSQTVEYRVFDSSERRIATVRELDQLVKKNLNIAGLDAAAFYVTQLIEQAPKLGSAYVSVAILYLNRGQYGRAAQAAEG